MNYTFDPKINVDIQDRCLNWLDLNKTYNIVILKPNKKGTKNVLTQIMVSEPNTKYVIHYNFTLEGNTIEIPADCILEIDGGDLFNGTLVLNDTIILNTNGVDIFSNNPRNDVTLQGTWRDTSGLIDGEDIYLDENGKLKFSNKDYDSSNFSGLGRKYLRKNVHTAAHSQSNTMFQHNVGGNCYIFWLINDRFYYPYDGGSAGFVAGGGQLVRIGTGYDKNELPLEVRQGTKLDIELVSPQITSQPNYKIIFPKGVNVANGLSYGNGKLFLYSQEVNTNGLPEYSNNNVLSYVEKNFLTQEMMQEANTRYIIQYDYDLNGETIIVPANCILDFQGGSIKNGNLIGSSFKINNPYKVDFVNVNIGETEENWAPLVTIPDYQHVIMSEQDFTDMPDAEKRADTIYFIVES